MVYLAVYACLSILWFISPKASWLSYYFCLCTLFVFVGFRYRVGCDWDGYQIIFDDVAAGVEGRTEWSFWTLVSVLQYFELEYPYINVIASAVFFLGLHALARRQPDPLGILVFAFPILIINLAMSGVRQAIGLGFLCFAYNAFTDHRLLRFLLFVGIAATFHTSAAVFLIIAPFLKGQFSRRRIFAASLLAIPAAYSLYRANLFDIYVSEYISAPGAEAAGAPFRTGLVALTGVVFLWFLDRKWEVQFMENYKLVKLSSYMMIATFPLSFFSSVIADRFAYYLNPIQLIIVTCIPFLVHGRFSVLIASVPYAMGTVTLIVWVVTSSLFALCYEHYQMWL